MDNLAHALCSVATTAVVAPRSLKKHTKSLVLASMIVANLPDIDFLMNIFGQETYHFHHRGFTHSFLGLPLMIILGVWIQKFICRKSHVFTTKQSIIWASAQLLGSHFLLDYLTSYGVMFFYPASFERYALPLMFIIDPMFWFVGLMGVGLLMAKQDLPCRKYRFLGMGVIASMLTWWTILGVAKIQSHQFTYPSSSEAEVQSFPGPLAPLLWLVVHSGSEGYDSKIVSYMSDTDAKVIPQAVPDDFYHDHLCPKLSANKTAQESYEKYKRWATYVICEDTEEQSCTCHSMRYAFSLENRKPYFGSALIKNDGNLKFIPPDRNIDQASFMDRFVFFK